MPMEGDVTIFRFLCHCVSCCVF